MKIFRILSIVALVAMVAVGCNKNKNQNGPVGGSDVTLEQVAKEWKLYSVDDIEAEFVVYLNLKSDMSFEMYQQVYTLDYECYVGTYSLEDGVIGGSYASGQNWKSDYRVLAVSDQELTLQSIEEKSIKMVYRATTIPDDLNIATSRASSLVPIM